jgi:hypothetical protein
VIVEPLGRIGTVERGGLPQFSNPALVSSLPRRARAGEPGKRSLVKITVV